MARTIAPSSLLRTLLGGALLLSASTLRANMSGPAQLHALLVGGGPDLESNTAQIEEHLRFVTSLVPQSPSRIILYADGKSGSHDLSYTDWAHLTPERQALDVLLPNDGLGAKVLTRTPMIGAPLDGPSKIAAIDKAFHRLAASSAKDSSPVLLYFAGHGSTSGDSDDSTSKGKTSYYNLWGDEDLDPATLQREIAEVPQKNPVVLVMAECFSGGFGDILFRKADQDGPLGDRLVAGFFASEPDREAAGCGTETNSPLYQDFSSYFFGALSGRDKLGHRVEGADYDGDGKVSLHEAWCYALIHDESIDTPVCTSLVFLRRFEDLSDSEIFTTPWQSLLDAATPAEKAALLGLSDKLGLTGDLRVQDAYDRLMFTDPIGRPEQLHAYRDVQDKLAALRVSGLASLFVQWPALRWHDSRNYNKAVEGALQELRKNVTESQALVQAHQALDKADDTLDAEEAYLVRITDLAELIVRAREYRAHGEPRSIKRFENLWALEQQSLPLSTPAP
jgi:Caspase domain